MSLSCSQFLKQRLTSNKTNNKRFSFWHKQ